MLKKKINVKETIFQSIIIAVTLMIVLATIYPVYYVLCASFSEPQRFLAHSGLLIKPLGISFETFKRAFSHPLIMNSYGVTLYVLVVGTALNLFLTIIGAYVLSRRNLYFRNIISVFIIFTMYFSGGIIPFYLQIKGLGMLNSLTSLILPVAINTYNLIILRTAFFSVPESIEEAAFIDGAGNCTVLFKILLPLTLPSIAVISLYYAVGHWNAWFNASLFLSKAELYPLQIVMRQILMNNDTNSMTIAVDSGDQLAVSETLKYAVIVIATVPILIIYPFLQRFFVKGVMVGAVKG